LILHVANLDKFIPPFVNFINERFSSQEHLFFLRGSNIKYPVEQKENVLLAVPSRFGEIKYYLRLLRNLLRADKIIIHGLFDARLIAILSCMPWVLKKCYWVIWGGDLYYYQKPKPRLKDKLKETFKSFVIKRIGYLVTYIPGDFELAKQWYRARGEYRECLMYLSNVIVDNPAEIKGNGYEDSSAVKILVGNSADPSNNQLEIFEKLLPYKEEDIKIFAPLSYGDEEHAKNIISHGEKMFGNKFVPMTQFMPLSSYYQFLRSIDIAVFNHRRQQAMGNTITLLGMGKKVYMREDVSHFDFFISLGVDVKRVDEFTLDCLASKTQDSNIELIKRYCSIENLKSQWSTIFEG